MFEVLTRPVAFGTFLNAGAVLNASPILSTVELLPAISFFINLLRII